MYPLGAVDYLHHDNSPSRVRVQRQLTHIISPSLSFSTDLHEEDAFKLMLDALVQVGFSWLSHYSGPKMGVKVPKGETIDVAELIAAFDEREITNLPLTGIKATLVHDSEEDVHVKLKVNCLMSTKVELDVKGTIEFPFWDEIQEVVHERFG